MFSLQTTRGCPYNCGFCDIIIMDGRKPRENRGAVLAEVDHCVNRALPYLRTQYIRVSRSGGLLRLADYSRKTLSDRVF